MKAMIDINVLVDVLQRREPFLHTAAILCDSAKAGRYEGVVASHAVTTLYYVVRRYADRAAAGKALDWILSTFEVVPCDKAVFLLAKSLDFTDFEDAVVAASAAASSCDCIATRNIGDFRKSPVRAITPEEACRLLVENDGNVL